MCLKRSPEQSRKHMELTMKSKTPEYRAWQDMRQRCNNPKCKAFKDYGARGIKICDRWGLFENFLLDLGERPHGMSLDRKQVNGNYEPSNCRWATTTDQNRNLRTHQRINIGVSFNKRDKLWGAWITVSSKKHRIGAYRTESEAIIARANAENKYWINGEQLPESGPLQKNNRSGHAGVCWDEINKRWVAYAYENRKKVHLGSFLNLNDAVSAKAAHGIREVK